MARIKPWLKMWGNWMNDPNLAKLNLGQRGAWWSLYTVAHNCRADGRLVDGAGHGLTLEEIRKACNLSEQADSHVFGNMIKKMLAVGGLMWDSDILVIVNYLDEQEVQTSEEVGPRGGHGIKGSKEALRERVRRWREEQKKKQLPLPLEPLPPKDKNSTVVVNNTEEKVSIYTTTLEEREHPLQPAEAGAVSSQGVTDKPLQGKVETPAKQARKTGERHAVTDEPLQDPVIMEITDLYEKNIGELPHGGVVIDDMIEFAGRFKGDVKWIRLAFKEALGRNKRQWQYIRTILERWQDEGGPDGRAGQELDRQFGRKEDERRGAHEADRRGASEPGTKHKWKVKRSGPEPVSGGEEKR